jgi:hypothetical protein
VTVSLLVKWKRRDALEEVKEEYGSKSPADMTGYRRLTARISNSLLEMAYIKETA